MKEGNKIILTKDATRLNYDDNTHVAAWKGEEGTYIGHYNGTMHYVKIGRRVLALRESEFERVMDWENGDLFAVDNMDGGTETWLGKWVDVDGKEAVDENGTYWYSVPIWKARKVTIAERMKFTEELGGELPEPPCNDPIVEDVVSDLRRRSNLGVKKYGTTLAENNHDNFFIHLEEELMDAILYLRKIRSDGA